MNEVTFADRFKLLRILAGLSQEDVAEALDIPQSKIVYYEAGKVKPRKKTLEQITALFGCTEAWLTDGTPDAFEFSWSVLPPTRYSHLIRMVRDTESGVQALLPIFCREHNVRRAFIFSWTNLGSVFAIEYGCGDYSFFLMIKTKEPLTSILKNVLSELTIDSRPLSTEQIPETVWEQAFNPESSQDETRNSLSVLLQNIKREIPDRLDNLTIESFLSKYFERMKVLEKRSKWSFPCEITVSKNDGIGQKYALEEIADLLNSHDWATGVEIAIKFKRMADKDEFETIYNQRDKIVPSA